MEIFYDQNKNLVKLSFIKEEWSQEAKHVLVICQYKNQWLLTNHKQRGLEFPGGKKEKGESTIQTAYREVFEETGGVIEGLQWIAAYQVLGEEETFVKDVFFAKIGQLNPQEDYHETMGPVLVSGDIMIMRWHPSYSFIMKDNVIKFCISCIENELLNQKKG